MSKNKICSLASHYLSSAVMVFIFIFNQGPNWKEASRIFKSLVQYDGSRTDEQFTVVLFRICPLVLFSVNRMTQLFFEFPSKNVTGYCHSFFLTTDIFDAFGVNYSYILYK